jgi:polar amino acid transport system substrate-binding protein
MAAAVFTISLVVGGCSSSKKSVTTTTGATATNSACGAIQSKYPTIQGKTQSVGIAPTIPGYETVDPNDPTKLVGFDIDLLAAVSKCAGFTTTFDRADFQTLVPSLQAGRFDMVISNLIASATRAQQVNFVVYQKDDEALIVAKGNPKNILDVADLCGKSIAVFPGTVQAGAAQTQSTACTAAGKGAITINTYADFNGCLQGVLTGRSDSFIEPVSVVTDSVNKYPAQLSGTPPIPEFSSAIGMAFNKSNTTLRDAVLAATTEVQSEGTEKTLFTKWQQDPTDQATASLLP